jgi:hypothetical protein
MLLFMLRCHRINPGSGVPQGRTREKQKSEVRGGSRGEVVEVVVVFVVVMLVVEVVVDVVVLVQVPTIKAAQAMPVPCSRAQSPVPSKAEL